MTRAIHRTLRGLREHTYLFFVSTGVIGATLLLIGTFALVSANLSRALGSWEYDTHISAYFSPSTDAKSHPTIASSIAARPEVAEASYVSSEAAQAWMAERAPDMDPLLRELGPGALPASVEIVLRPEHSAPDQMRAFADSLTASGGFSEVDYGKDWLERVDTVLSLVNVLGSTLGAGIAIAALFLVGNTIHLVVYARRDELEIMRLVGATDSYILTPFLLEGVLQGLLAAGAASGLLWLTYEVIRSRLSRVLAIALPDGQLSFLGTEALVALFVAGVAVGVLASLTAVSRYLRKLA